MIHPRSLDVDETRPVPPVWVCTDHGQLPPGESECPSCEPESGDRRR